MKIGKINRLAKAGETVSVRLPDGKTISAKAGNDLRSTTVLVSKTQSGWFAFSSQGETKTLSTQVVNRRPRQATPEIYPIKVLFSVEYEDKFEFYIGGDRNTPIKIWELEKVSIFNQGTTRIKSAAINSTGNKPDDWIVMIQYLSPDLIFTAPSGQTVNTLRNLEASAILQPNLSPIIHVGANGSDPVGNGFFAPRDPYIWYFLDEIVNVTTDEDFLVTGEDYRPYLYPNSLKGIELSSSGSSDNLATSSRFTVSRPWLPSEGSIGLITSSLSELWLYNYVEGADFNFLDLGLQIGNSSAFAYLTPIYDVPGINFFVEGSAFVSNLYVPSVGADTSLLSSLYWENIEFLSLSQIAALLNVFSPNFHDSIVGGGLYDVQQTNLVSGSYIGELAQASNQAFTHDLLQVLNIVVEQVIYSFPLDNNVFQGSTSVFRRSSNFYDYKRIYTESQARLVTIGSFALAYTEYFFSPKSTISSGTFHYVIVSPLGIERTSIPYDLTTITYIRRYDRYAFTERSGTSLVTKGSASGNMQMMGVTFDVDVKKTIFSVAGSSFIDRRWAYSGHGEAIRQRGLDNSAIIHKIDYGWQARSTGASVSFTVPPSLLEESFYYKDGFKHPLTTTNQDFRTMTTFYLDMSQQQEVNVGPIINHSGFRIIPLFNAEDILENNKISRVAWSEQDGDDLKEFNIKLDVKTYRIIVDGGTATIPDGSKIKTFKVKNLSPILSQLDPAVADTAKVHSMSCYFN